MTFTTLTGIISNKRSDKRTKLEILPINGKKPKIFILPVACRVYETNSLEDVIKM